MFLCSAECWSVIIQMLSTTLIHANMLNTLIVKYLTFNTKSQIASQALCWQLVGTKEGNVTTFSFHSDLYFTHFAQIVFLWNSILGKRQVYLFILLQTFQFSDPWSVSRFLFPLYLLTPRHECNHTGIMLILTRDEQVPPLVPFLPPPCGNMPFNLKNYRINALNLVIKCLTSLFPA